MSTRPGAVANIFSFFNAWVKEPRVVGAVMPSGTALAGLIASEITPASAPVLELGAGTGVFTRALLQRGVREEDLTIVEYRPDFVSLLRRQFPRARVLQMDAARIGHAGIFEGRPVGAAVSGIPMLNLPLRRTVSILRGAFSFMRPGSALYQFTYGAQCPVPRPVLDRIGLHGTHMGRVLLNLPPAAVYRITECDPARR